MLKIKNTCQESALVTLFNLHKAETINRKMRLNCQVFEYVVLLLHSSVQNLEEVLHL